MIVYKISNILNEINSILLPLLCFGCNARLSRGEHLLCTVCRHEMPMTDHDFTRENAVDRTFFGRVRIEKAASFLFFHHQGIVKNLLHHLKYRKQEVIGDFLGNWFGTQLAASDKIPPFDLVVPVPLHPRKLKKRGYNQVERFARRLAQHLNSTYDGGNLIRTSRGSSQTQKGRIGRWNDRQGQFRLKDPASYSGMHILLVDDVITTGATLERCAQALQTADKVTLYIATIAMVPKLGQ